MKIAYFTAGNVGAGHLARGLAIERAFTRAGIPEVEYRIFSAALPFVAAKRADVTPLPIPANDLLDSHRALDTELSRALHGFAPDLLLVDLFWAPVHHLLPTLGCEAWLLLRSHPRDWLIGPPALHFDRKRFARTFVIEPHVMIEGAERLAPIVIANRDELRPREELRRYLGVDDAAHLTLIVHAGKVGERAVLERSADDLEAQSVVRTADLHDEGALFPIAAFLAGADRIVGGAGYNLFWETRSLGLADRSVLQAFPRDLDDQTARIAACAEHVPRENGADALVRNVVGPAGFEPAA